MQVGGVDLIITLFYDVTHTSLIRLREGTLHWLFVVQSVYSLSTSTSQRLHKQPTHQRSCPTAPKAGFSRTDKSDYLSNSLPLPNIGVTYLIDDRWKVRNFRVSYALYGKIKSTDKRLMVLELNGGNATYIVIEMYYLA